MLFWYLGAILGQLGPLKDLIHFEKVEDDNASNLFKITAHSGEKETPICDGYPDNQEKVINIMYRLLYNIILKCVFCIRLQMLLKKLEWHLKNREIF